MSLEDIGGVPHGDKLKAFLALSFDDNGFPLPVAVPARRGECFWTMDPRWVSTAFGTFTANAAVGSRVIVPRTGIITSLAVIVGGASGNLDLGVYSISGTTRTKISTSGSTAVAGTNAYQAVTVNAPVNAGDVVDLVMAVDNNIATFARTNTPQTVCAALPSGFDADAVGSDVLQWAKVTSFVLPASFSAVTSAVASNVCPIIVAKLAPTN